MRKNILLLITLFAFSLVNAQEFSFGVKAGINYGATKTSDSDYNDNFKPILAPNFGVLADIKFTESFSVQPELLFSPSGAERKETELTGGIKAKGKSRINYLNIPVMAKYYLIEGLSIEAGPYLGFVLSAKADATVTGPDGNEIAALSYEDKDVKDEYKSIDFGLGAGVSYEIEQGFFITARYNLGLSDIHEAEEGEVEGSDGKVGTTSFNIKNNILQVSVGYKFL